jgi:uncharacterized protein with GYD domain
MALYSPAEFNDRLLLGLKGTMSQVSIIDAPNDETLAAAMLKLTSLGNFRTTTLRAFSADEMRALIAKAS